MASNVKPRLEALAVYLEQCENEGNFHDLRKQQFDLGNTACRFGFLRWRSLRCNFEIYGLFLNAPKYISHDFQLTLTYLFPHLPGEGG